MSNATQIDVLAFFIDVSKLIDAGRNAHLHKHQTSRMAREGAPAPTPIKTKNRTHPCAQFRQFTTKF